MADRVSQFLADLRDPGKYVRVPDVDVFAEHVAERWFDPKTGKEARPNAPGAKRKVIKFNREKLERIAASCNRRDGTGTFSPLIFGHTDVKEKDETKQPAPVGSAVGYRVAWNPRLKKYTVRTNFYIRRDKYRDAETFPRVSVEYWDDGDESIIDPISLLRRTPQLDLGQWVYSKLGRTVLRYSMAWRYKMADELHDEMPPDEAPVEGGGEAGGEELTPEMHDEYMRHCYSHKYARAFHNHNHAVYSKPVEAEAPPPEEEAPMPATEPPDALDEEEPLQHGMAFPSATNGAVPGGKKQYAKSGIPVQFAKEFAELRRKVDQAEVKDKYVLPLVAQGIDLDVDEEVAEFCRRKPSERDAYAKKIASRYTRSLTAPRGRVVTAGAPVGDDDGDIGIDHMERAVQYMRRHNSSWDDAVTKTKR